MDCQINKALNWVKKIYLTKLVCSQDHFKKIVAVAGIIQIDIHAFIRADNMRVSRGGHGVQTPLSKITKL